MVANYSEGGGKTSTAGLTSDRDTSSAEKGGVLKPPSTVSNGQKLLKTENQTANHRDHERERSRTAGSTANQSNEAKRGSEPIRLWLCMTDGNRSSRQPQSNRS